MVLPIRAFLLLHVVLRAILAMAKYQLPPSMTSFSLLQDPTTSPFSKAPPHGFDDSFDYIVVGGGTAGIPLAVRLAQNNYTVALVEAGGMYQLEFPFAMAPVCDIIGVGADLDRFKSPLHWGFVAEAVPGANYRDIHYPRGRCLGGSYVYMYMF